MFPELARELNRLAAEAKLLRVRPDLWTACIGDYLTVLSRACKILDERVRSDPARIAAATARATAGV